MKKIITLAFLCIGMTSCLKSTLLETSDVVAETKSHVQDYKEQTVFVNVINNAENLDIYIDTLRLCNVLIDYNKNHRVTYNLITEDTMVPYKDTTSCYPFKAPVQRFNMWKPNKPHNSNVTYFKLTGKLVMADNDFPIYEGEMFIPFSEVLYFEHYTIVNLTLGDNSPWYKYHNGNFIQLGQTVDFNVNVEDWIE